jgi:hypothetical protein
MKRAILSFFVVVALCSCSPNLRVDQGSTGNILPVLKEEPEYELIVLDPGFDTWYYTAWSTAKDRMISYYQYWNNQYVNDWNYRATHPRFSAGFDSIINYDANTNYGIEVERKLYYYFQWVETVNKQPILFAKRYSGF